MIYVLIAVLFSSYDGSATSFKAEFNTLQACQAAAKAVKQQSIKNGNTDGSPILVCATKG